MRKILCWLGWHEYNSVVFWIKHENSDLNEPTYSIDYSDVCCKYCGKVR